MTAKQLFDTCRIFTGTLLTDPLSYLHDSIMRQRRQRFLTKKLLEHGRIEMKPRGVRPTAFKGRLLTDDTWPN